MRLLRVMAACSLFGASICVLTAHGQSEPGFTIRVRSELTQISVVANDRYGQPVRGLAAGDFSVRENRRLQAISAVDFQSVNRAAGSSSTPVAPARLPLLTANEPPPATTLRGLRLVLLYFDLTSLETDDLARSLRAADQYLETFGPADRVAILSLDSRLRVQQDFTADRNALQQALTRVRVAGVSGPSAEEGEQDASETERPNQDRRLLALRILAARLERVALKKSVVLFARASGPPPEDLTELTNTLNQAVRAGVSIYAIDGAGLPAAPPLGDASRPGAAGISVLSGQAVTAQRSQAARSQDLLFAFARGTGGQAYFDTNDFRKPFRALEEDTREYYLVSYRSNEPHDGKFHTVEIRVARPGVRVHHQRGYYSAREAARGVPERR